MNAAEVKMRRMAAAQRMKQLGYRFPTMQPFPGISFRMPKSINSWAAAAALLGILAYAQCAIDIPGVDIPDLKDLPGVLSWLQESGINQVQVDIFGLQ